MGALVQGPNRFLTLRISGFSLDNLLERSPMTKIKRPDPRLDEITRTDNPSFGYAYPLAYNKVIASRLDRCLLMVRLFRETVQIPDCLSIIGQVQALCLPTLIMNLPDYPLRSSTPYIRGYRGVYDTCIILMGV